MWQVHRTTRVVYANGKCSRGGARENPCYSNVMGQLAVYASRRRARRRTHACINKARHKHLYYWCQCVKYLHGNAHCARCNMAPCVASTTQTTYLFSSPAGDTALLMRRARGPRDNMARRKRLSQFQDCLCDQNASATGHFAAKCMRMLLRHPEVIK